MKFKNNILSSKSIFGITLAGILIYVLPAIAILFSSPINNLVASFSPFGAKLATNQTDKNNSRTAKDKLANHKSNKGSKTVTSSPTASSTNAPASSPVNISSTNPFSGQKLYIWPDSNVISQVQVWQSSRPIDAAMLNKIAAQPQAIWFGDWNDNVAGDVHDTVTGAAAAKAMPVMVIYNIPLRDCGEYSAGGAASPTAYKSWIDGFASGLGNNKSAIILEPDAVANLDCLSSADQQTRYSLINYALDRLHVNNQTYIYLDAGNSRWHDPATISDRLNKAGINKATGFSLNVSNFITTEESIGYGNSIANLVGGKHYVIDTSRNGLGPTPDLNWCNPAGRALGLRPTSQTASSLADAYLWIKTPGESDGSCNGGPTSGEWWPEYALGLAQRAAY